MSVGNGQTNNMAMSENANALDCMHDQQAVMYEANGDDRYEKEQETKVTDELDGNPQVVAGGKGFKKRKYIVRRLTPTECARLQGFPDWWTDGADGSDSAKYKLWGNGIALPCAEDVLGRIAKELNQDADQQG